jgi:hypothetical protein
MRIASRIRRKRDWLASQSDNLTISGSIFAPSQNFTTGRAKMSMPYTEES